MWEMTLLSLSPFCSSAELLKYAFVCWWAHRFNDLKKEKKEWANEYDYNVKIRDTI